MNRTSTSWLLAASLAGGVLVWLAAGNRTVVASDGVAAIVPVAAAATVDGAKKHTYVGSNKCKLCHLVQTRSWAKTKMGQAMDTLRPGHAVDIKKKFGLDPNKDYSTDAKCVKCHTTGFGREGGYAIPDPNDKKAVRRAKKLVNVGCESCHGPGSEYIKVFQEIFRSRRKYKIEELYAAGLRKIDGSGCVECHNEEGATFDKAHPFDFATMKDTDTHEHVPLKQRE